MESPPRSKELSDENKQWVKTTLQLVEQGWKPETVSTLMSELHGFLISHETGQKLPWVQDIITMELPKKKLVLYARLDREREESFVPVEEEQPTAFRRKKR